MIEDVPSSKPCVPPPRDPSTPSSLSSLPSTQTQLPPHRSHSPTSNLKRSSPFQFGSRYLQPTDDPYEFNAWDHVDSALDPDYVAHTLKQLSFQREHPVSPFDRKRFNDKPERWWDRFYGNNKERFFRDRKWLRQEFPILAKVTGTVGEVLESVTSTGRVGGDDDGMDGAEMPRGEADAGEEEGDEKERVLDLGGKREWAQKVHDFDPGPWNTVLEVGAGAGNTIFPLLKLNKNPDLMIHACDFSKKAVQVIRDSPEYDPRHLRAEVWDIASPDLPPGVEEGAVDVVVLVFIFSALNPQQWAQALRNVWRALRPGGEVCFRDYGRNDLAQVRFKKGRLLGENFYVRGDGTRVYFFAEDELRGIWSGRLRECVKAATKNHTQERGEDDGGGSGEEEDQGCEWDRANMPAFDVVSLGTDQRMLVNRSRQLKMYRCWMQGRFSKPRIT